VKHLIGIMQGRLSPPRAGRLQYFPVETWQDEFALAREAGLGGIEWVYEAETDDINPLANDGGVAEIRQLSERYGIAVPSICADFYMTNRLVEPDGGVSARALEHLAWLAGRARVVGARHIVLPFVDSSALRSPAEIDALIKVVQHVLPALEREGIEIHLETDVESRELMRCLAAVTHDLVRANYDIGNRAAQGYDPADELRLLGGRLGSVHVKDRVLGGGTVPLGTGAADFPKCFGSFLATGYRGSFVLQAARVSDLSPVVLATRNRQFVEFHLANAARA
jgi:L-ribulose-5-phosphate 3-epimerase